MGYGPFVLRTASVRNQSRLSSGTNGLANQAAEKRSFDRGLDLDIRGRRVAPMRTLPAARGSHPVLPSAWQVPVLCPPDFPCSRSGSQLAPKGPPAVGLLSPPLAFDLPLQDSQSQIGLDQFPVDVDQSEHRFGGDTQLMG